MMRRRRLLAYGIPAAAALAAGLTWNGAGGRARRSVAEGFARFRRSSSPSVRLYDLATGVAMGGLYTKIADDLVQEIGAAERILDIGCGPGRLLVELARRFPDARLTGVDLDPAMLAAASERLTAEGLGDRVELLVADAVSLPLPDDSFDLVASSFSLHHWGDPAAAMAEVRRVLEPRGLACLYDVPGWFGQLEGVASIDRAVPAAPFAQRELGPFPWPGPGRLSAVKRARLS